MEERAEGEAEAEVEVEASMQVQESSTSVGQNEGVTPMVIDVDDEQMCNDVDSWLSLFKEEKFTELKEIIKNRFRFQVPILFAPDKDINCLKIKINEPAVQRNLIIPLMRFITNNENPDEFLQNLSIVDDPPTLCGRVFKVGEPTYTCRDCAIDTTCVLCVECFTNSGHKSHKYKIATSGGGGYCDCGDLEAWNSEVHCKSHLPKNTSTEAGNSLSDDIVKRTKFLFEILLEYSYTILTSVMLTQLPQELQLIESEAVFLKVNHNSDTYCTVLYNDESHTFDQVIQTLIRAIECTKKDAIEYATLIDREGRSLVKCSCFQVCHQIKQIIERQTSRNSSNPLKVTVMHSFAVAHEMFALKILYWIKDLLPLSIGFRHIFCDVITKVRDDGRSLLEGIMLADTQLWKYSRVIWHNLFITGMLKEYDQKKEFAKVFAKNYAELMRDFFNDDHEHSFSITSLSVQIFTVPTLAHFLIETYDVFGTILRSFMSEAESRLNQENRLEFDRGGNSTLKRPSFEYLMYIASLDLKYLLTTTPTEWSESLGRSFLYGFDLFIKLLGWMEGMDAIARQVGQHMEYEPDWESAFNIHMKFFPVFSLIVDWCAADRNILRKAYRKTLQALYTIYMKEKDEKKVLETEVRELANHSATCFVYDVSSQPVSIHIPLNRLLAALHLKLESHGLDFFSQQLVFPEKPSPEILMEPALRAQVLIAQVHAGLWKRNGYALLNQLYFYHNVRCRREMKEKDIISLQIAASLIESNEFVIHCINRYNLMEWAQPTFEDNAVRGPKGSTVEDENLKYTIVLLEEFFGLIGQIISSRFVQGVGTVSQKDCIRKEVIQLLCIEPSTHSTMNKNLIENVKNYETGIELVLDEVADIKKTASGACVFQLKPELYNEYDMFFCHYQREDQSEAEERQRERKKNCGEPEVFPPPRLPSFTQPFNMVVNILKSDVLLYLISLGLERYLKQHRSFNETLIRKVLHIIGYAVNEELMRNEIEKGHFFQFVEAAKKWDVFTNLEKILKVPTMSQHHELILWIINQCNIINGSQPDASAENMDVPTDQQNKEDDKQLKSKMAAQARERYLEKIAQAQKSFMKVNAELFVTDDEETEDLVDQDEEMPLEDHQHVCLGYTPIKTKSDEQLTCILCQESEPLSLSSKTFVMCAFVQRSSALCNYREYLSDLAQKNAQEKKATYYYELQPLWLSQNMLVAPMITNCGHMMHIGCWKKYFEGVIKKEKSRPYRLRHPLSFDIDRNEFLCPMCDCISNTVIPLTPPLHRLFTLEKETEAPNAYIYFMNGLDIIAKNSSFLTESSRKSSTDEEPTGDDASEPTEPKLYPEEKLLADLINIYGGESHADKVFLSFLLSANERPKFSLNFTEMMHNFMSVIFATMFHNAADIDGYKTPIVFWQGVSYTIKAWESYHRYGNGSVPFFGEQVPSRRTLSMNYLVRGCAVATGFHTKFEHMKSHVLWLIKVIFTHEYECILEIDAFSLLVALIYSMPYLYQNYEEKLIPPMGTFRDKYLLQIILVLHITQALMTSDFDEFTTEYNPEDPNLLTEDDGSNAYINHIWKSIGKNRKVCDTNGIWSKIGITVAPFLRCAAKFFESLTGISTPLNFYEAGDNLKDILSYIGLSNLKEIFENKIHDSYVKCWTSHHRIKIILENTRLFRERKCLPSAIAVKYPIEATKLYELPEDYSELINSVSLFTCKNGSVYDAHDSRTPTLCLLCGMILCSQSYCCQGDLFGEAVGACNFHAYYCGGGCGIFLRIRECKVFFLSGGNKGKGCYMLPPYQDEFGETDQGLRRGNPMTLNTRMYEKFRKYWLKHEIPEEIARITEHSTNILATDWQYL